jgi:8-oxo-dGTP pyrophosphatase MutT (NUDIX family)
MKTLLVAVCVVEYEGKYALHTFKRNYLAGFRGIPGGKFDSTEHLPAAAGREIKEELGIEVHFETFHGIVDEFAVTDDGTVRCMLFICSATPSGQIETVRRETDEGIIEWFTREEIESRQSEVVPSDYRILQDLIFGGQMGYWKCQQTIKDGRPVLDYFERVGAK